MGHVTDNCTENGIGFEQSPELSQVMIPFRFLGIDLNQLVYQSVGELRRNNEFQSHSRLCRSGLCRSCKCLCAPPYLAEVLIRLCTISSVPTFLLSISCSSALLL